MAGELDEFQARRISCLLPVVLPAESCERFGCRMLGNKAVRNYSAPESGHALHGRKDFSPGRVATAAGSLRIVKSRLYFRCHARGQMTPSGRYLIQDSCRCPLDKARKETFRRSDRACCSKCRRPRRGNPALPALLELLI